MCEGMGKAEKLPGEVWRGPVLIHLTDRTAVVVMHDGAPVAGIILDDGRCINAQADERAPIFAAWAMWERTERLKTRRPPRP